MADVGCLLIDDVLNGGNALADWLPALTERGVRAERFRWDGREGLYPALQRAYQRVRRDDGVSCLLAWGSGCHCALALAGQLPADRVALIDPSDGPEDAAILREYSRVRRYARRGAAFCAASVLIVPGPHTPDELPSRLAQGLYSCRVAVIQPGEDLWTNRKEVLKLGVFRFLREGITPKSLAENPEMCIIYG